MDQPAPFDARAEINPPRRRRRRIWIASTLLLGVAAIVVGWSIVARASAFRMYIVPSSSMSPAIGAGDRVCVDLKPADRPRRGEVWIFAMPAAGLGVSGQAIKRVVGLPGETVRIEAGKVWVDGRAIDEPYLARPMTYTMPARTLGPAEYFLLGDDRDASNDSHIWGPVPAGSMFGRVLYRVWPLSRAGGL